MKRLLIIEDDAELRDGLRDNLALEGYEIITAGDGDEGFRKATRMSPHAIILDLMLPKRDGFEVCRALKEHGSQIPILILSARAQDADKVRGFELGADDYVTKPFSIHELLARVRAMLRRAGGGASLGFVQKFGDVEINFRQQIARKGRRAIPLSTLESDVLRYLVARRGEIVSRDDLLGDVWGHQPFTTTRSVDNLIVRLRQKLESDPRHPQHILTVHGTGYKFVE